MSDVRPAPGIALDIEVQHQVFGQHGLTPDTYLAVPRCSTEIAHAWTVVDKLREWGCYLTELREDIFNDCRWCATFTGAINEDGDEEDFTGSGETAAIALCRAALAVAAWWNETQAGSAVGS